MKRPVQLTPALTAALICTGIWFVFWLLAFRPAPVNRIAAEAHPEVIRLVAGDETLRKLKAPTLFALPSGEGFSGRYIDNQISRHLSLEKTNTPTRYLPREANASLSIDKNILTKETGIPQTALPVPNATASVPVRSPSGIHLFLSPELNLRTNSALQLHIAATGLPETIRVILAVRPDGTVGRALFETPVTNAALISAVRQLRFNPAAEQTESWMDIRFTQEER